MAAITLWVDPVSGSDAAAGTSFATAVETIDGAHAKMAAAGNGNDYTVNLVNTGTHEHLNTTRSAVDNQTTSTFLIRGTDSSGNPAMVTIAATAISTTSTSKACWYIRESAGVTFEYLRWDCTAMDASTLTLFFLYSRDDSDGHLHTFRYCEFLGADIGDSPAGLRNIVSWENITDGQRPTAIVQDCYLQNMGDPFATSVTKWIMHHCVRHEVGDLAAAVRLPSFADADCEYYNNTLYLVSTGTGTKTLLLNGALKTALASGSYNELSAYNNVVWMEITDAVGGVPATGVFIGTNGTATIATGTVGYNILYTGPILEGYSALGMVLYDEEPFAASYTGDIVQRAQAASVLFNDIDSAYAWTPEGSAVALSVAQDLRLVVHTTAGLSGGLPGALPAAATDYTASASTDRNSPAPGETVTLTFGMSNAGTDSTGVEATITGITGLTQVSVTASQGTYSAGLWQLGNLNDGASASLVITYTVDADQSGSTLTPTITWSDGLPSSGNLGDDTASVTLTVLDTDDVNDPSGTAVVPYLDVLPIFATDLQLQFNMRMSSKKNRLRRHYIRADIEGQRWREFSTKQIVLGTNTTQQVNLGGIQRGEFLFVISDEVIQVSVGNQTNLYAPAKVVALQGGDFEQVWIKNTSLTTDAVVWIGAVD